MKQKQRGQSMVEYVVILSALTAALLMPGLGSVGTSQSDANSLLKAVADKHRGHGYALSLSEIPETADLAELAAYYESLGKYPELSPQIKTGAQKLGEFSNQLTNLGNLLSSFNPGNIQIPPQLPSNPSLPSFP
ncbi:MAG: hypothetical protein PVG66_04560 [Chromatiales bacterium]|jgi:hypothetical protein